MTGLFLLTLCGVAALSFANGANDVSKGVSTLSGGHVATYRAALLWGTIWTVAGALVAFLFARGMLGVFTHGFFTMDLSPPPLFSLAVGLGAFCWVMAASVGGLPVSTTHAIAGAILGLGLFLFGSDQVRWASLAGKVLLPLLISPVLSGLLSPLFCALLRFVWRGDRELCLCIGVKEPLASILEERGEAMIGYRDPPRGPMAVVAPQEECIRYYPTALRLTPDTLHWFSSGLTSFSRGMNDAPKIVAVAILSFPTVQVPASVAVTFLLVAIGMGLGSWIAGQKVTRVMGERITEMDQFDGFVANLTTSFLVVSTALMGLPVSTTHCSNGAIIGVGLGKGKGVGSVHWDTVKQMLLAWCVTVPLSGVWAVIFYVILSSVL